MIPAPHWIQNIMRKTSRKEFGITLPLRLCCHLMSPLLLSSQGRQHVCMNWQLWKWLEQAGSTEGNNSSNFDKAKWQLLSIRYKTNSLTETKNIEIWLSMSPSAVCWGQAGTAQCLCTNGQERHRANARPEKEALLHLQHDSQQGIMKKEKLHK